IGSTTSTFGNVGWQAHCRSAHLANEAKFLRVWEATGHSIHLSDKLHGFPPNHQLLISPCILHKPSLAPAVSVRRPGSDVRPTQSAALRSSTLSTLSQVNAVAVSSFHPPLSFQR